MRPGRPGPRLGPMDKRRILKRLLGPAAGGAVGYAVSYLSACAGST